MAGANTPSSCSSSGESAYDEYEDVSFIDGDYLDGDKLLESYQKYWKLEEATQNLTVPHRFGTTSTGELLLYLQIPGAESPSPLPASPSTTPVPSDTEELSKPAAITNKNLNKSGQSSRELKIDNDSKSVANHAGQENYFRLSRATGEFLCWKVEEVSDKLKYSVCLEKNKVFVRGLAASVTEDDLRRLFEANGDLQACRLVTNRKGRSKGIAYIEYSNENGAEQAVREMDGILIDDKKITVVISNPSRINPVSSTKNSKFQNRL